MTPLAIAYYNHNFCFGFRVKIGVEMDQQCFVLFRNDGAYVIDDFINDNAVSGVVLNAIVQSERFKTLYDSR